MKLKYRPLNNQDLDIVKSRIGNKFILGKSLTKSKNPQKLLNQLGLYFKTPRTHLKNKQEVINFIISHGGDKDYDWKSLLTKNLPPVIIINNGLVDGIHRCIISTVLKESILAEEF